MGLVVIRIIFDPNTKHWKGGGYGVGDPWITFGSLRDHFRLFCSLTVPSTLCLAAVGGCGGEQCPSPPPPPPPSSLGWPRLAAAGEKNKEMQRKHDFSATQ